MKRNLKTATQKPVISPMLQIGLYFGALVALFLISNVAFAGSSGGQTLGEVAANVTGSMTNVAKLITAASYVAGVGFALMGMFKFKAHKDQPTQVPLSQPIVLLAIAAGLLFLPSIITTAGSTIFGGSAQMGSPEGGGLPGGS